MQLTAIVLDSRDLKCFSLMLSLTTLTLLLSESRETTLSKKSWVLTTLPLARGGSISIHWLHSGENHLSSSLFPQEGAVPDAHLSFP